MAWVSFKSHQQVRRSLKTLRSGAVTKILSCRVNTTSRQGIKQLRITIDSIFPIFSYQNSRRPCSCQPGEIPSPRLLMTATLSCMAFSIYEVVHVACLSLSRSCLRNDSPEEVLKMHVVNIQNFS